jgi:hypothetical protein
VSQDLTLGERGREVLLPLPAPTPCVAARRLFTRYRDLHGASTRWDRLLLPNADTLLNSVYWVAFPPECAQVRGRIDEVLDRFRTRGRLPMSWIISPATQPRDLGRILEWRGFTCVFRGVPGMTVDLE